MDIYTRNNIKQIQDAIALKTDYNGANLPFYGTRDGLLPVMIDQDHFPYKRYFRGVYDQSEPVIYERESGWRIQRNACYKDLVDIQPEKARYCWQNACSTVLPCKPKPETEEEESARKSCSPTQYILQP